MAVVERMIAAANAVKYPRVVWDGFDEVFITSNSTRSLRQAQGPRFFPLIREGPVPQRFYGELDYGDSKLVKHVS
jgi:hypothetical protein